MCDGVFQPRGAFPQDSQIPRRVVCAIWMSLLCVGQAAAQWSGGGARGASGEPPGEGSGTSRALEDACRRAGTGDPRELLSLIPRVSTDFRRSPIYASFYALGLFVAQRPADAKVACAQVEETLNERRSQFIDPRVCRMLRDVYFDLGDDNAGLNLQRRTLRQQPRDPTLLNMLAWDLATLPGARFRNGVEAVELAKKACEETRWKDWRHVDTYAAAVAENQQWEQAVRWQTAVIAMATKKFENPEILAKLKGAIGAIPRAQVLPRPGHFGLESSFSADRFLLTAALFRRRRTDGA